MGQEGTKHQTTSAHIQAMHLQGVYGCQEAGSGGGGDVKRGQQE
jgi:hypothetical protein